VRADQAAELRARIAIAGPPLVCPGVADGLAARLAAQAGFEGVYVSGAGSSAARGLPDMGLMTLGELLDAVHVIATSSGLPAVVDGDTGFGDVAAIRRTMRELASAGAAAVHLEDQPFPRKCGYLTSEKCVSIPEMLRRLDAARAADSGVVLIARTDALLTEGIDGTVERAVEYAKAGVDLLMVNGVRDFADLVRVFEATGFPMLHNVSGSDRTPALTDEQSRAVDVRVTIHPIQAARAAALAVQSYFASLKSGSARPPLMPFGEYMDLAGWRETAQFEDDVASGRASAEGAEP
jgi:2-methylisocitrate lyase-like PEP mutase family enzyme